MAYVIYDGMNLYYSRYPEGWVGNLGHAWWYATQREAEHDSRLRGGRVVRVGPDGSLSD